MKVLKFGGTSIGTAGKIRNVSDIVKSIDSKCIIVVSAFEGITDKLAEMAEYASTKKEYYINILNDISDKHIDIVNSLFEGSKKNEVKERAESLLTELENLIEGVHTLNDLTPKINDRILSYGEQLSSCIISNYIEGAELFDSREFIATDSSFGNAKVDMETTAANIKNIFKGVVDIAVVPGFIAQNNKGEITTLGRGGSDYSASLISAALDADELQIWTDVDGFMTADPKKVPKALAIESLSYAEAMELSHFGAEVIYTPTIQPAYKKDIQITIKNTFNPEAPGTVISKNPEKTSQSLIKGVSSIDYIDLITLQGPGMVGVKGTSMRLFGVLANSDVNIILITQASSEYSISFAITPGDTLKAVKSIQDEFEVEIKLRKEINVIVERELSVIAIVGERMKNTPGISANLFTSLGRNGINVIATAQGSSELNISVVIKKESLKKALNVIHEGFFLSHYKELHLYLAGVGTVGGSLIKQIKNQQKKLLEEHRLKINVVGICRSKKMYINSESIDLNNYMNEIEKYGEPADIKKFITEAKKSNLRNSVFIDCTANETVAHTYKQALESYISVVTANKIACSSEYSMYKELKDTAKEKSVKFIYETNVGAGLPIISTINDLIKSGDKIIRLEAVLSGTLNFIFNELSEKIPMSKAIQLSMEKGFAEPDPRIDLSGIDVIRKLLILARETGVKLEMNDVEIKPFLPEDCFKGSLDDFWNKVQKYDDDFEIKRKVLVSRNKKWRFIALLDNGKATIELKEVDITHPAYPLEGSNNIILITTDRYHETPMVIRGYGAGSEVTAAGVFADVIRVANV